MPGKDLEPVITDWAMSVVEGRLRERYPVPDNTSFVSFVQEPKEVMLDDGPKQLPPMAVFAVISDHPTKTWAPRIMTHGTCQLRAFHEAVAEQAHFANQKPDPALVILDQVVKHHMQTMTNLSELIH